MEKKKSGLGYKKYPNFEHLTGQHYIHYLKNMVAQQSSREWAAHQNPLTGKEGINQRWEKKDQK